MTLRATAPLLAALVLAHPLSAQGCRVGKESNEAKLLAYYAVPMVFSPSGTIGGLQKGQLRIGFDVTVIPGPGDALRKTKACFLPKDENSQLSPVFPRPHITLGVGGGIFIEGMYLPPVTVADATPSLGSVAVGVARGISRNVGYALRVHGTFGRVKGPITCNRSALQLTDVNKACFGTNVSEDTFEPGIKGAEAALTFRGGGKVAGYAGAGFTSVRPRFQVGFVDRNGAVDNTVVTVGCDGTRACTASSGQQSLSRLSVMGGGSYSLTQRLSLAAELYSVPKDMTTIRLGGALTLGKRE